MNHRFEFPKYDNLEDAIFLCYQSVVIEKGYSVIDDEDTRNHIKRIATWLKDNTRRSWGLIINGSYGNGKTTMLLALKKLFNALRINMQFVSALDVASIASNSPTDYENLKRTQILAIDDIGTEASEVKYFGNTITPVADIIVRRYNDQLFTLITSNLNKDAIGKKYGGFIGDRLYEMFDVIQYNNSTYRKLK